MKIGMVIVYKSTNYGALLQAFATQRYIENAGLETEIIVCENGTWSGNKLKKVVKHFIPVVLKTTLKTIRRKKNISKNTVIQKADQERNCKADEFVSAYMHGITRFSSLNELREYVSETYSTVMVGSDQLWTPQCFYNDLNTLRFVPDSVNKVSYATSMGVSRIPWYTTGVLRKFISRINYISVREVTGRRIIEEVSGRDDVIVVPDPTLLLEKDEWDTAIQHSGEIGDYIFCYFLANDGESMRKTLEFAKKRNIRVVAVRNIEVFDEDNTDYGIAEILESPSISEFVNHIRNARYVFTDSFHGTLFSIINHKEFVTFYRTKHSNKDSRNSRIDDFLEALQLDHRIVKNNVDLSEIVANAIDYGNVDIKVSEMRKTGREFLHRALI